MLDANDPQQMLGYTYANDNPISGSDPTGLLNADDGTGGGTPDVPRGAWTPDPFAGGNDNHGNDGGTNNNDANHKSSGWSKFKGWTKKRVNDVTDKVDEAHNWAQDHASTIGTVVAVTVTVVGTVTFCAATAGAGCLIVAGLVSGAAGAGLGYVNRVDLSGEETFSTTSLAAETAIGGLNGAASGAGSLAVTGVVAKIALGKATASASAGAASASAGSTAETAPAVVSGTNARGLVNSRGSFRKATLQNAWDGASAGPSGGRLCPTCGGEVSVPPHTGVPRDWDGSHFPSWTNRLFPSTITRREVLDNYNRGVSLVSTL